MQVRITEPGWAGFTGLMGHVQFTDGVSVDISRADAAQLAANVRIEDIADNKNPSDAQALLDHAHTQAPVETPLMAENVPQQPLPTFTEAQLMEAADKGGIKALRDLVAPLGINGKSIAEIIGKVLQGQAAAAPTPAAE